MRMKEMRAQELGRRMHNYWQYYLQMSTVQHSSLGKTTEESIDATIISHVLIGPQAGKGLFGT